MRILETLALAAVAAWLGIAAFFSFVVAPIVFRTLDRAAAGEAVSAVLPGYYMAGVALIVLALVAHAILTLRGDGRVRHLLSAVLCAAMLGGLVWAWTVVLPSAEAARRERSDTAFARAHRSAIELNGLAMAAGAAVLVLAALRRGPRTVR